MKTIFKEGQKVYDQYHFPNKEGKVLSIESNTYKCFPICVTFCDDIAHYSNNGTIKEDNRPTLSTKPYEVEFKGFEQKAPTKTYEDALEWLGKNSKDRIIYADEAYVNKSYELAFETLKKLVILRNYYNEGWKPKHCSYVNLITTRNGTLVKDCLMGDSRILHFKSLEIRNKFFEEQKELLEIAKPLL